MKNSNLILFTVTLMLAGCFPDSRSKPVYYSPPADHTLVDPSKVCHSNPMICDAETLCIKAKRYNWSEKIFEWEKSETFYPHVKEAKRRGLSCGVGGESSADKTVNNRPDHVVCVHANNGQPRYVEEAKRRGLSCGVLIKNNVVSPTSRKLGKKLEVGINRLSKLGHIDSQEKRRLHDKIKRMSQSDYARVSRICTKAFEQIEPQKCDTELLLYLD